MVLMAGYSHKAQDRDKWICSIFSAAKGDEKQVSRMVPRPRYFDLQISIDLQAHSETTCKQRGDFVR